MGDERREEREASRALRRLAPVGATLLALALASTPARAHATRTATLDVTETAPSDALVVLRAPSGSGELRLDPPPECQAAPVVTGTRPQGTTLLRLRCPGGLDGASLGVGGLGREVDVVITHVVLASGATHGAVLTERAPRFVVPARAGGDTSRLLGRYARLGIEHVLSGLDHVLFLLALVWQASDAARRNARTSSTTIGRGLCRTASELARTATAFTFAHTVTLTATAFGWLHVPQATAEACIALSLVLAALDVGPRNFDPNVPSEGNAGPAHSSTALSRAGVAACFGLVHGLGFAAGLAEAGLPEQAVVPALVAFNVGVEIGQGLVLAGALGLALGARRVLVSRGKEGVIARAATASAYLIGAFGAYLLLARTSALFFP